MPPEAERTVLRIPVREDASVTAARLFASCGFQLRYRLQRYTYEDDM